MIDNNIKRPVILIAVVAALFLALIIFLNGTKSGNNYMINTKGEIISRGSYRCSTLNENGFVSVTYENRWPSWTPFYRLITGIIGNDGNYIVKPKYYKNGDVSLYGDSFAVQSDNAILTILFLDEKGVYYKVPENTFVRANYLNFDAFPFVDMAPFQEWKYGYMTTEGEVLSEPVFRWAREFSEDGLALVQTDDLKYGYIGLDGEFKIEPRYKEAYSFSEGLAFTDEGYIDIHGNVVIDRFSLGKNFSEGYALVSQKENGALGYIDKNGDAITDFEYGYLSGDFKNGYARVEGVGDLAGKYGFIDSNGNMVIDMEFSDAGDFSKEGYAPVQTQDGLWGYIKTDGSWYIEPQYKNASNFENGVAMIQR